MDLDALRARVRRLASISSTSILSDADLTTVINEVYREVCSLQDWPFLHAETTVALVADDREASLPAEATMREVQGVVLDDGSDRERLHQVSTSEIEYLFDDEDEKGAPIVWAYKDASTLLLHPPCDKSYTLRLRGLLRVAELSADTDEPVFDEEFHPIVAYAAAARLLVEEGDKSDRIKGYNAEAAAYMMRMRDRYLSAHDTGLFQLGGRRSTSMRGRPWIVPSVRWR